MISFYPLYTYRANFASLVQDARQADQLGLLDAGSSGLGGAAEARVRVGQRNLKKGRLDQGKQQVTDVARAASNTPFNVAKRAIDSGADPNTLTPQARKIYERLKIGNQLPSQYTNKATGQAWNAAVYDYRKGNLKPMGNAAQTATNVTNAATKPANTTAAVNASKNIFSNKNLIRNVGIGGAALAGVGAIGAGINAWNNKNKQQPAFSKPTNLEVKFYSLEGIYSVPSLTAMGAAEGAYQGSLVGLGVAGLRNALNTKKWTDEEKVTLATGTEKQKQKLRQKMQDEGRRVSYGKAAGIGAAIGAPLKGGLTYMQAKQLEEYLDELDD